MLEISFVGCRQSQVSSVGGPILVQVPNSNSGNYGMQVVELTTIKDLAHLEGDAVRFYIEPTVFNNQLTGESPNLRFMKTKDNVYVPLDSLSLQLVALYYQFEKLMQLDQALGIKPLNNWPQKVAINAKFTSNNKEKFQQNNAAYSSTIDAYLFVPYTNQELPLMVNAGVVGHEHFHSLFNKLVIKPLGTKFPISSKDDSYNYVLMRGVNEGLADVWGWVFSGDVDFVGRSLPSEKVTRRLNLKDMNLFTRKELKRRLKHVSSGYEVNEAYALGIKIARAIYGAHEQIKARAQMSDIQIRMEFATALIKTTTQIKDLLENKLENKSEQLVPGEFLLLFYKNLSSATSVECEYFKKIIQEEDMEQSCL